jgi:hypothetical protein
VTDTGAAAITAGAMHLIPAFSGGADLNGIFADTESIFFMDEQGNLEQDTIVVCA